MRLFELYTFFQNKDPLEMKHSNQIMYNERANGPVGKVFMLCLDGYSLFTPVDTLQVVPLGCLRNLILPPDFNC
jgi:hypothetical protein